MMIGCMSVRSGIWLFIFGGFLLLSCEKLSPSRFEMIASRESGIDISALRISRIRPDLEMKTGVQEYPW